MPTAIDALLLIIAAGLLTAAALHDIAARTVPNWIPAALAIDGIVLRLFLGTALSGVAIGLAVFAVAALLWRGGLMGGGDVKLLAAAAIAIPSALVVSFLLAVALAGGALALLYLLLRLVVSAPAAVRPRHLMGRIARAERRRIRYCRSLPYACAIASGALFTMIGG